MNRLPSEIQHEIFSYLWLNEMADCRLVSHFFKDRTEESMKRITHLGLRGSKSEFAFLRIRFGLYPEEMDESYVKHTFFSEPSVKAQVPSTHNSPVGSRVFAFLAKFCPNLQVLQMDFFNLSCDDLLLLRPNLQYFTCLKLLPGSSRRTAVSLLRQLPNLKGYRITSGVEGDQKQVKDSWNRAMLQLNRPVCTLGRKEASSWKTVELLARGGTKCLHLLNDRTGPPPFSLPQSLAESLVELSVEFEPTVQFCPFPLPNLLYLTVNYRNAKPSHHLGPIVSAPALRCLTYEGSFFPDFKSLSRLRSFVNHFAQLRVLSILNDSLPGEKISLPTGLEKLNFQVRSYELLEYSSPSLTHLHVGWGTSFSLACPSLKVLSCQGFRLKPESMPGLLHSLSKCATMVQFSLTLDHIDDSVSLQPLIDLLSSMTRLTHLDLRHLVSDAHCHHSIDFEGKKFPSLSCLYLDLRQTKITLHLTNSFIVSTRQWPVQCLELRGPNKNYFVSGYHVEFHPTKN